MAGDSLVLSGLSKSVLPLPVAPEDEGQYGFQKVLVFEPAKMASTRKYGVFFLHTQCCVSELNLKYLLEIIFKMILHNGC
jgi:hypothetical protein